jgi:hypothetical protein
LLLLLLYWWIWMRAAETFCRHSPEVQLWKQEQEQEQEQEQAPKKQISLAAPLPCLLTPEHEQGQRKRHAAHEYLRATLCFDGVCYLSRHLIALEIARQCPCPYMRPYFHSPS